METVAKQACPCCRREFTQMDDYPQISVEKMEWSPIGITPPKNTMFGPVKEPAQIWGELCQIQEFQDYILRLKELKIYGKFRTLEPKELLPPKTNELFAENGYFKWAYEIPLPVEHRKASYSYEARMSQYYLAWQEESLGTSHLTIFCEGPNFGSGGGPTLAEVGKVLTIHYRGVLPQ